LDSFDVSLDALVMTISGLGGVTITPTQIPPSPHARHSGSQVTHDWGTTWRQHDDKLFLFRAIQLQLLHFLVAGLCPFNTAVSWLTVPCS
jgi:hypothetical protein